MARRIVLFIVFLFLYAGQRCCATARDFPLPDGFHYDAHTDMKDYTGYIIPCVEWLQNTPLNKYKKERARLHEFVLMWLQRSPDISIGLPDYAYKFHGINEQFLYLFMEGWIKYTLETNDMELNNCRMAGMHTMLDFYKSGNAGELGSSEFLNNLLDIDKAGKLRELFDTSRSAKNFYLYLHLASGKKNFRYDENYFNFKFNSINLLHPRNTVYRYLLDGYYDKWIVTSDGSATYPRLPPGEYTFKVQGSMYPDFTNAVEQSYTFKISSPFWKEPWFLFLVAASGLALGYYIIRQRERNLENIALLKHERIVFEYEHLKSQVNPHFLFNSLNTLTNLIARDQKKAIDYTENLSSLYHRILAYHDNDLVLLSEEMEILENYFSIQKGRFGDALRLIVNIPDDILHTKKVVPLALQILIENVIKHNVISDSRPLVTEISANENEIIIKNVVYPKISKEKGEGLGLANIKRRYDLLTKKPVIFGLNTNEFTVILPLL